MTTLPVNGSASAADGEVLAAARVLLSRMGVEPADLAGRAGTAVFAHSSFAAFLTAKYLAARLTDPAPIPTAQVAGLFLVSAPDEDTAASLSTYARPSPGCSPTPPTRPDGWL
jgi:hypothetical protein